MAVEKIKELNVAGLQKLATTIYQSTNSRIKERILTASDYATDNSNATHVLSAQAFYGQVGNIAGYSTSTGTGNTVIDLIKRLDLAIGTPEDTATDETVHGRITSIYEELSALTHLTYQVVQGPINTAVPMNEARDDVLYLQKNDPSYKVGRDGLLLNSSNAVVVAGEADAEYAAYFNQGDSSYYKANAVYTYTDTGDSATPEIDGTATHNAEGLLLDGNGNIVVSEDGGVRFAYLYDSANETYTKATQSISGYSITTTVLDSEDPVFENVALVEDATTTLYVCQLTKSPQGEVTAISWIEVGNTDITLTDYISKSDYDVRELQQRILEPISDTEIITACQAAFNATDPYTGGTNAYLDGWMS